MPVLVLVPVLLLVLVPFVVPLVVFVELLVLLLVVLPDPVLLLVELFVELEELSEVEVVLPEVVDVLVPTLALELLSNALVLRSLVFLLLAEM